MFYGKIININEIFPLTREIFDQLIHSSELGGLDYEVTMLLDRLAEGGEKWTPKVVNDRIAENKRKRPYICTSDFISDAGKYKRLNKYAKWSGYSTLDIDHIDDPLAYYADHIKGHEVEWGIECAFRSPSQHGIKIIFRIAKEVAIADAQRSLAQLIGCDYDSSTKDAARATFLVSKENFFYITDNFLVEKVPDDYKMPFKCEKVKEEKVKEDGEANNSLKRWRIKRPTKRVMMILDVAMRSRSITKASFMIKGQRHTQLKNLLSTQVGLLLTKEEFMGGFLKLCPKFRNEDNLWQLVSDFYENYISEDKPLSNNFAITFRQVLNIDDDGKPLEEVGGNHADNDGEASLLTTHSSLLTKPGDWQEYGFDKIEYPAALDATLNLYPERFKLPVLCSLLPLLGAYADGVRVTYIDNHREPLALMAVIVGEMASGKSNCKRAVDLWRTPMEIADSQARKVEEEWRQERKGRKANEKAKPDPEVFVKEVPITISCSTLLRRLKLAKGRCIFSFGEELDTLRKTNSAGNWSAKFDIYRMAFDNAVWGQDYNSDMAESGMVKVFYNWVILGTYGSFEKCFKADSVENGLGSRILVAEMPDNAFEKLTSYSLPTPEIETLITEAAENLIGQQGSLSLPTLDKHVAAWLEERRMEALRNVDYVMDTFRKRASVIAFRCATIFHLIESGAKAADATESCALFYEAMANYVLRKQMALFGPKLDNSAALGRSDYGSDNARIFDALPKDFSFEDLRSVKGKTFSISTIYNICNKWRKANLIEKLSGNTFRKI